MSVRMVGFLAKFTYNLDYERSLFFLSLSSGTCETRKWPRAWLKARDGRGFAARRSRTRALPSLNLKENTNCLQSTYYQAIQTFPSWVDSFSAYSHVRWNLSFFRLKNSKNSREAKETAIRKQLFRERLSEKVHATIPKGIVGAFKCTGLQRNLKEWHGRPRTSVCEC